MSKVYLEITTNSLKELFLQVLKADPSKQEELIDAILAKVENHIDDKVLQAFVAGQDSVYDSQWL